MDRLEKIELWAENEAKEMLPLDDCLWLIAVAKETKKRVHVARFLFRTVLEGYRTRYVMRPFDRS